MLRDSSKEELDYFAHMARWTMDYMDHEYKLETYAPEVTGEMVDAGLLHLYEYHPDRGVGDVETVTLIFLSMLHASSTPQPERQSSTEE